MHDWGDRLVAQGFAEPVMDMEYITLTYSDVKSVMQDLRSIGAHNATAGRAPLIGGLPGKSQHNFIHAVAVEIGYLDVRSAASGVHGDGRGVLSKSAPPVR